MLMSVCHRRSIRSNDAERAPRTGRRLDSYDVPATNDPAGDDDTHHARLPHQRPVLVAREQSGEQTPLMPVELNARVAQSGHFDHRFRPKVKARARRKAEQVDAASCDILAEVAGANVKTCRVQLVVQLAMDKVNLPQVRLCRVPRDPRSVFDGGSRMRVGLDAQSGNQANVRLRALAERVRLAPVNACDDSFRR
jgi:hypothetical protein